MPSSRSRQPYDGGTASESEAYELLAYDSAADPTASRRDSYDDVLPPAGQPGLPPTARQAQQLARVPGPVPRTAYAIASVEFAERASYYGVKGVFANFIQRPLPPGSTTGAPTTPQGTAGALGLGLGWSTALGTVFTMMAYTTPLIGGILADTRWGKLRTIAIGAALGGIAHALSVYAALPSLLQAGTALAPFLLSLLLLGGSAGLIKANIAPLMAEQYAAPTHVSTTAAGELVIVDREATVQRIMSAYFHAINLGAFAAVASTFAEKYVGFWLAFLIPGAIFFLLPPVLYLVWPHLVAAPPPLSSALVDALAALRAPALKLEDSADAGTHAGAPGGLRHVAALFALFAVYNVADSGLDALMTSLAGSMTTDGIPNDFLEKARQRQIPLLDRYIYPALAARGIAFGPVPRIAAGFALAAAAMGWLAGLQHAVYRTSPCGYAATTCESVSPLSAWLVLPAPLLTGLSESLAVVSATELGYTLSPPGLKSIVNALFLATQAVSAALVLAAVPLMHDPALVWPFAFTALATAAAAVLVSRRFAHLDTAHASR
ncbi:hypothetical protein Q5752_004410 [Cryptotrichosporon argae]